MIFDLLEKISKKILLDEDILSKKEEISKMMNEIEKGYKAELNKIFETSEMKLKELYNQKNNNIEEFIQNRVEKSRIKTEIKKQTNQLLDIKVWILKGLIQLKKLFPKEEK